MSGGRWLAVPLLAVLPGAAGAAEPGRDGPAYLTPDSVLEKAIELAGVRKGDRVYDLAGDDARFAVAVARGVGASVTAVGLDSIFEEDAGENVASSKVKHLVTLRTVDLTRGKVDLSKADVVYFVALPSAHKLFLKHFESLPAGARVITYDFPLEGVRPRRAVKVRGEGDREHTVYLYAVPLAAGGGPKGGK